MSCRLRSNKSVLSPLHLISACLPQHACGTPRLWVLTAQNTPQSNNHKNRAAARRRCRKKTSDLNRDRRSCTEHRCKKKKKKHVRLCSSTQKAIRKGIGSGFSSACPSGTRAGELATMSDHWGVTKVGWLPATSERPHRAPKIRNYQRQSNHSPEWGGHTKIKKKAGAFKGSSYLQCSWRQKRQPVCKI